MQGAAGVHAATAPAVLLPPGVYATTPSPATTAPALTERLDRHHRLRRAMAAREETLLQITRLIMGDPKPQKQERSSRRVRLIKTVEDRQQNTNVNTTNTTPTTADNNDANNNTATTTTIPVPTAESTTVNTTNVAQFITSLGTEKTHHDNRNEANRLKSIEAEHAKERAHLENLVYELRRELEKTGHTLRDQTVAMKSVGMGMARMGPYRTVKAQRELQAKLSSVSLETLPEKEPGLHHELDVIRERVKTLEDLLVTEKDRSERAEKRCAELKAVSLRSKVNTAEGGDDAKEAVGGGINNSLLNSPGEKRCTVSNTELGGGRSREIKTNTNKNVDEGVRCLEDTHRMARRMWISREREYRRYIEVLETTISRMERQIPPEKSNKAILFNLTLKLVSCERLFNRRNNGMGSIDPFVVVYSPTGERALETTPCEDTECPQYNKMEDVVTLKAARGSPWYIRFEVYSRGVNNARLFLGQAKVPVGSLLEDVGTGGFTRYTAKLRIRDRETDDEIVQHSRQLGTVVFDVAVTVAGGGYVAVGGSRRSVSLLRTHRLLSPSRDGEEKEERIIYTDRRKRVESSSSLTPGSTLRIAGAKGILKRGRDMNSNPYVVVYDSYTGNELTRTPPVVGLSDPSWEGCDQASFAVSSLGPRGSIIFHVFDHDRDGRDEFLGEARLSKDEISSGKESHELKLCPREDEPLMYIREHHDRLGRLIVHCLRSTSTRRSIAGNKQERAGDHQPRGLKESSKILSDELAPGNDNILLHPVTVQVYVEMCEYLCNRPETGDIFVRMTAPDSTSYLTSVVPHTFNPSWSKANGSAKMLLHPLDSGVIGFSVMMFGGKSGNCDVKEEEELPLGYAQLTVEDLFLGGLGRKKLQLGLRPQETDSWLTQHSATLGSIVVSFALPDNSPLNETANKNTTVEQTTEVAPAGIHVENSTPLHIPPLPPPPSSSSYCASSVKKTEDVAGSSSSLPIRIFVKQGRDLLDCDQAMFNVFGVTDPRVLVWVGPDHAFTVPEKHDTVNPVWSPEEGECLVSVQSTHVIRFEVQDVDVSGFDSMGCATIHVSEIIDSPGEHCLPVMLDGKQYGTLTVLFTIEQ